MAAPVKQFWNLQTLIISLFFIRFWSNLLENALFVKIFYLREFFADVVLPFNFLPYLSSDLNQSGLLPVDLFIKCWMSGKQCRAWSDAVLCITKTCLFKYTENFTTKKRKFSDKKFQYFSYFAQNIECGCSLEPPRQGGSNEYPQSMFWAEIWKLMSTPVNPNFTI